MTRTEPDPMSLPLDQLRSVRSGLQHDDDAVSYVRRLAQAKLDLVRAEQRRRHAGAPAPASITEELPVILAEKLTGGPARPPRPVEDFSSSPLAVELDELHNNFGGDVASMDDVALELYAEALDDFEHRRSEERRQLFARIDGLSEELVRRYRDGEADVEGLLAAD